MNGKIMDLFAGAGGLSEGFRRCGFDVVAHVEMDKDACNTLKTREAYYYCKANNLMSEYLDYITGKVTREAFYKKIPKPVLDKVINLEISDRTAATIFSQIDSLLHGSPVLGIIGGPPCQAYSLAGRSRMKEKVNNDPRNYLYLQYLRFIKRYQPSFFVFENVQGLLSAKNGLIFEDIKKQMEHLGYSIGYKLLDARDFGVVQHRKRIIIIGFRKSLHLSYPKFKIAKYTFSIKDIFSDLPTLQAGESNNLYLTSTTRCLQKLHIRENKWTTLTQNQSRPLNQNDKKIYKLCLLNDGIKYNQLPKELIRHNNQSSFLDRFKVVKADQPSHTIVAHISKDGHHYIHPDIKQCRSLTVREAARIQSFPDNYYFESSRTAAYKQIGNAVPVYMAEQIAESIKNSLD